jgi:inorganic pyrophosphatase
MCSSRSNRSFDASNSIALSLPSAFGADETSGVWDIGRHMKNPTPEILPAIIDDDEWRVIVETPKGSCNKYRYDVENHIFTLAQVLPEGLAFPLDFGFLPSTLGADGDPLDVLLLMDQPAFCGCMVPSRLVGVIEAEQTERDGIPERNDRLVAVPLKTHRYGKIHSVKDLEKQMVAEIERFFVNYNQEEGKKFKILDLRGPGRAESLARKGIKQFAKKHPRARKRTGKR